jgi:hypothetical protein
MRTKWTLSELVASYAEVGISKRKAVRYIVDCHMQRRAPGKGNKAAKREAKLIEQRLATAWAFEDAFNAR